MTAPERYGSRTLVRLLAGIVLAVAVAAGVFLTVGGAGEEARGNGMLIVAVVAIGALLVLIAPAIRPRGPRAAPGATSWTGAGGTWQAPATPAPAGPPPARWSQPVPPTGQAQRRVGARAKTARRGQGEAPSVRSWAAPFVLGIVAVIVMVLTIALLWHGDQPAEALTPVYVLAFLLTGVPCVLAGFISGRRGHGHELATWMQHTAGVVAGVVVLTILNAVAADPTGEDAPYVLIGLLIMVVPASTVGFLFGQGVSHVVSASRGTAGIPGTRV